MSIGTSRPEMEIFIVVCHAMTVQPKKMALHSCQYSVGSINCIINFCISLGDTSCLKSSDWVECRQSLKNLKLDILFDSVFATYVTPHVAVFSGVSIRWSLLIACCSFFSDSGIRYWLKRELWRRWTSSQMAKAWRAVSHRKYLNKSESIKKEREIMSDMVSSRC